MLIASISGIRGTWGGPEGTGLTPPDVVRFAAGYAAWLRMASGVDRPVVVVGRDARLSGPAVRDLVVGTLVGCGVDVVDLGLSTTPTVELAVVGESAHGGIVLTASHNPREWNALKLLDARGEFLGAADGARVLALARDLPAFPGVDALGAVRPDGGWLERHVDLVLGLDLVDAAAVRAAGFRIAVDAVNSSGGLAVPMLLRALGCEVVEVHCEPTGDFAHNPEPLPAHLGDLMAAVVQEGCDLGIAVDPDVDRLAFVTEQGTWFGEEYTLVAVADYVLGATPGPVVSNLSSTRALKLVADRHGCAYTASAVGEAHVVAEMKRVGAVIGGEGNGGVIYPASHYGRDALVGIGLFLSHLARAGSTASGLRASYPELAMSKDKVDLPEVGVERALERLIAAHPTATVTTIDGVKFDLDEGWVHLRRSNTEPILRIYAEGVDEGAAVGLGARFRAQLEAYLNEEFTTTC
jgi:phosphomannomutase